MPTSVLTANGGIGTSRAQIDRVNTGVCAHSKELAQLDKAGGDR